LPRVSAHPIRRAFLFSPISTVSGCFLHARDTGAGAAASAARLSADDWKLRRIE
jgi:hypothetical protein